MSWATPIYDRSISDYTPTLINGKWVNVPNNAKGFFNCIAGVTINGITSVDDWGRVYGNASYINAEILTNTGHAVTFTTITTPTTSTDPATMVSKFNTLLANIEVMRAKVVALGASIPAFATLSWVAGAGAVAPTYTDVNQWEYVEYLIKTWLDTQSIFVVICGVATTGGDYVMDTI